MKHYYDFDLPVSNAAVAFGRFDGMHIGHRAVIKQLSSYRNSVVISFSDNYNEIIYTELEKEYVLKSLDIGNMVSVTAQTYESMDITGFVEKYLVEKLQTRTVVAGANYERLSELKEICSASGIELVIVPVVKEQDEIVSTELIRESFAVKDVDKAIRLLGGSYVMTGPVVHGKKIGRKYGMPTANICFARNKIWPTYGVYGTKVHLGDSNWQGMTNIGLRPSDDSNPVPSCETFILNFNGDIYDTPLILEAFKYVRPVLSFPSLTEVKAQIDKDIETIRNYLSCNKP